MARMGKGDRSEAPGQQAPAADDVAALFEAKALAELARAASALAGGAFAYDGTPGAPVLLLKGVPGPADVDAERALAGADRDAADKSLAALGLPPETLAVMTRGAGGEAPAARTMRTLVAAADPRWVIALDAEAAADAASAAGIHSLSPGRPQERDGRVWLAVDGLEASLTDPARKRRVWAQFRTIAVSAADAGAPSQTGGSEETGAAGPSAQDR